MGIQSNTVFTWYLSFIDRKNFYQKFIIFLKLKNKKL